MARTNLIFAAVLQIAPVSAYANDAKKGRDIVQAAEDFHADFKDSVVDGIMILRDSSGSESKREMLLKVLEDKNNGNDSLMVFNSPKDIKGTAMLTDSKKKDDDDQWIYLPALKRVKRITTSNRSGPFLGSEFTYEDLIPRSIDKYKYKFDKTEACGKDQCNIVLAFPNDKKSAYQKHKIWITEEDHLTMKTEFYDRKNAHVKTMVYEGYKKYGKHWGVDKITMSNHKTKKSTTFMYSNYKFGVGMNARNFDQNALKRGR